jgi:PqqD family protein of HPr-rel-A system
VSAVKVVQFWSAALEHFLVREWDGEMVLYDRRSGDTHALDRLATAAVKALGSGNELSAGEIVDRVIIELEEDEKADPTVVVGNALNFLKKLGLATDSEH